MEKAKEVLDQFPGSKFKLINDKKKLLEAEILNASGKGKEALDQLYKLFSDPKSEIAKDFILLKMAQIQEKAEQLDTATANLEKITEDYPQSLYSRDAQELLSKLKNK
jgi:outer membrane protein assembly factor BamD (BamD/ComL family)